LKQQCDMGLRRSIDKKPKRRAAAIEPSADRALCTGRIK
jgi:hypothetical protein